MNTSAVVEKKQKEIERRLSLLENGLSLLMEETTALECILKPVLRPEGPVCCSKAEPEPDSGVPMAHVIEGFSGRVSEILGVVKSIKNRLEI